MLWSPERDLYRAEMLTWLSDRLPAAQFRVVALMFGLDGNPRSYHEVSRILGISTMAVKRRRHEAVESLRHCQEFRDMLRFAAQSQAVEGRCHGTSHE